MHIPDGLVSGQINVAAGAVAAAAVGFSAWHVSRQARDKPQIVPLLATTGAFVFAAQMLNFPIGGGTSGHFMGAAVVAALLGPWSACLVLSLVLVIQCLGFADGGLTALGTNVLNMGVIAGLGAYGVMRAVRSLLPTGHKGYLAAAALGSWTSIVLAAAACAWELASSGTSPAGLVFPAMVGTHAIIGVGEVLITVTVLSAVAARRPDLLPDWASADASAPARIPRGAVRGVVVAGFAAALALGALASPFASSSPDGLERVAKDQGFLAAAEGATAWHGSPLPDYSVPGVAHETASTGMAGLMGTAFVFLTGYCLLRLAVPRRMRHEA